MKRTLAGPAVVVIVTLTAAAYAIASGQQAAPPPAPPIITPGPAAARFPRNAEEFDKLFHEVKNWGRWGTDDQLGSANLITDAKRRQALALAKTGTSVSLARNPLTEAA